MKSFQTYEELPQNGSLYIYGNLHRGGGEMYNMLCTPRS